MRTLFRVFSMIVLTLLAGVATLPGRGVAAEPAELRVVEGTDVAAIRAGDRTLLQYCTKASPMKPYVRQLFTPDGVQFLRDSPFDHKHHHALDVRHRGGWREFLGRGRGVRKRETARSLARRRPGSSTLPAREIMQTLDWTDTHGKQLLVERRDGRGRGIRRSPARLRWSFGIRSCPRPRVSRR